MLPGSFRGPPTVAGRRRRAYPVLRSAPHFSRVGWAALTYPALGSQSHSCRVGCLPKCAAITSCNQGFPKALIRIYKKKTLATYYRVALRTLTPPNTGPTYPALEPDHEYAHPFPGSSSSRGSAMYEATYPVFELPQPHYRPARPDSNLLQD